MTEQETICKSFVESSIEGILGTPFLTLVYLNGSTLDKLPRVGEQLYELIVHELNNETSIKMMKEIQINIEKDDKVYHVNSIEIV